RPVELGYRELSLDRLVGCEYYRSLPSRGKLYSLNMPMGSWVYYQNQDKIQQFKMQTIYHFSECSTKENAYADANNPSVALMVLEEHIFNNKNLYKTYIKFLPHRGKLISHLEVVENKRDYNEKHPLVLISVCVYKKIHHVERWMREWYSKFNLYNSRIALIHNFDGDEPNHEDKIRLLALKPDYYVPRYNRGQDMGIFQDLIQKGLPYFQPDFDLLFCFADDSYPLH